MRTENGGNEVEKWPGGHSWAPRGTLRTTSGGLRPLGGGPGAKTGRKRELSNTSRGTVLEQKSRKNVQKVGLPAGAVVVVF